MKNILVLGAGQSTPYLIAHLLEHAREADWFVTVADRSLDLARRRVGDHPRGNAITIDANDDAMLAAQVTNADLVVNLLAPAFQHQVAWECVEHGRHMISASYRDRSVRDLHLPAQRKGVLILCEVGLDPGIDHMSAMSLIAEVRQRGGVITSFTSYGSGIPAPDSISNPLKYAVTWNPRNVVMSAEHGAEYLIDGKIKIVPHWEVFRRSWVVEVEALGTMEAYPNRDSLAYREVYGLQDATSMVRGTLRYPGWSETWLQIVRLGLPNETLRIPDLARRTYGEVMEMFLPRTVSGGNLAQRVANHLHISPTGAIMDNLRWLGLFDDQPTGAAGETAADMMIHLLTQKLTLKENERDMVVLRHELQVRYPGEQDRREQVSSTMLEYGQPGGFTAMSKTVGLPAAVAARLILNGQIPITGSHIPTHPAVYQPILEALRAAGLQFTEQFTAMET